jgi:glycosyltransferase involved in cell wall biosynthesis
MCDRLAEVGSAYNVGFVGPELLPALYASADISVVPSSWETFGFTVLESLASGVATIASRTGGIKEQIVDGESGRLIVITDDEATFRLDASERIAAAILELVANPDLRSKLGAGGRERVLHNFSEERLGQDLFQLFHSLCRCES